MIVKMIVEKQMVECRFGRGNRSSRRKPAPAPPLFITKSHMNRHGIEPGPQRWDAGDSPQLLVPRSRIVELYLHSPMSLHGVMLFLVTHTDKFTGNFSQIGEFCFLAGY
jgi:hypothetical protein